MGDLMTPEMLYDYQRAMVVHQLSHDDSMIWAQMGLGKTVVTLTSIVDRMRAGIVKKTLIFGPLRVVSAVWHRQAKEWTHTKHLRFSIITGCAQKRARALFADADVYLCNYENMNWLAEQLMHYYISQGRPLPFQFVVYDEVSMLKNSTSKRMNGGKRTVKDAYGTEQQVNLVAWRKLINHFKYRTGLTGTPASNGYLDLHGQYLAVDGGQRLGEYITHFKDSYFASDYNGWTYTPTEEGKKWIESRISDITIKLDAKDYLQLPTVRVVDMFVDLPPKARKAYEDVEKELFTRLDSGQEIELFSKVSVSNKCLQFCNGTPYVDLNHNWEKLHDAKLDALEEVLEAAQGQPVLVAYNFKSDAERIMARFKKYKPVNLTEQPANETEGIVDKWNSGGLKLLIGHPRCLSGETEVLTEHRGWVPIVEVLKSDRVFDGVEWVSHGGCELSGERETIEIFGIRMTENHKLLINGEWVEAKNVRNDSETRSKAVFRWEAENTLRSEMRKMCENLNNVPSKLYQTQSFWARKLSTLFARESTPFNRHTNLEDLARYGCTFAQLKRSQLRWARDWSLRRVAKIREFLSGYVTNLRGWFDNRKNRRESRLFTGELPVGYEHGTTGEQTNKSTNHLQRRGNSLGRVGTEIGFFKNDVTNEIESGDDGRRGGPELPRVTLQKVYDLIDCGPRHRFIIRNTSGEAFVSHNSMGHGIDGLQKSGNILVWFGLNWSLELYDQMNGRLDRQGQKNPVSIIRILCRDTLDIAVSDAITRKDDNQKGLKDAIDRYRRHEGLSFL